MQSDLLPQEQVTFSPKALERVKELVSHYPAGRQKSALLPVLHLAQAEFGYCSVSVMDYVAGLLSIEPIEVYEVASFYTMFHLNPVGKYVLEVCRTGPCCLLGAEKVIDHIKNRYGIEEGQTSPDGMFTLKPVECLAACGFAPVMQIREQYYENLTTENIDALLDELTTTDPKTIGYGDSMPVRLP